jgi:hypothetical protein
LTTFLAILPILRHDGISQMTSKVLRNITRWNSHNQFLAEHLLLGNRKQISDHFTTYLSAQSVKVETILSGKSLPDGRPLAMSSTYSWIRSNSLPLPWEKLMPRQELEKWFHAHFLKLYLPFPRQRWDDNQVFAPLNITTFFRLINHVYEVGYPAHWLSAILSKLCEGEIVTTARAPRALVTDVDLVLHMYPSRKLCLKPFMVEFKTLLGIWRRLLPFGLHLSNETLPDLRTIREFSITFHPWYPTYTESPNFVLVLKNRRYEVDDHLRQVLLDDETGDTSTVAVRIRSEPGIHVISTFKWKTETAVATFWLEEGIMDDIQNGCDWEAYIWRTDTWLAALGPVLLHQKGVLNKGDSWV